MRSLSILVDPDDEACLYCGDDRCNGNETCSSCSRDCGTCGDDGIDCTNGKLDGQETDTDCGGDCAPCDIGDVCDEDSDCASGNCDEGKCAVGLCENGEFDPDNGETDEDCGGDYCEPCETGSNCDEDDDCAIRNFCDASTGKCVEETCDDGLQGSGETDLDCGGVCADEGKTCADGEDCINNEDCSSGFCDPYSYLCTEPKCDDYIQNGDETDTDCGGMVCDPCGLGDGCESDLDCLEGKCVSGECKIPSSGGDDELDSDGDGMSDEWERQHGFDPYDPSDGTGDKDDDGLTNKDEFRYKTNPAAADTDRDGHTDLEEIQEGTDPLDETSFPKGRSIWSIILLIILIAALLGGGGYFAYFYLYEKDKKKGGPGTVNLGETGPRVGPKKPNKFLNQMKKPVVGAMNVFKQKEKKKHDDRAKIFDAFVGEEDKKKDEKKDENKEPLADLKKAPEMEPDDESKRRARKVRDWIDLTKDKKNKKKDYVFKKLSNINKQTKERKASAFDKLSKLNEDNPSQIVVQGEGVTLNDKVTGSDPFEQIKKMKENLAKRRSSDEVIEDLKKMEEAKPGSILETKSPKKDVFEELKKMEGK
jgi:hypothetical protein